MTYPSQIRDQLRQWLIANRDSKPGDVLINELCIYEKRNRADLVYANGSLVGFEVKSAGDTLARWKSQMEAYFNVFDEVWLCCHWKHASKAIEVSEVEAGIIIVDEFDGMAILRPAKRHARLNSYHLAGLLWRSELDSLCRANQLPVVRSKKIKEVREHVARHLPLATIRDEVLASLKERYRDSVQASSSSIAPG